MDESRFVIAGGGMVAGYAAKQMVESGLKPGELTILSSDSALPYERPPLSKGFLAGRETEENIQINPADFYKEKGIDVKLDCRITAIHPQHKRLSLQSGGELGFERLIIATGSTVRKLQIPGAELANVLYLRSLKDSEAIRKSAEGVKRAAIIGGGFIGMEVASVLAQKGIEVTMVLREDRIWKQFFSPPMSAFFEQYYEARGVRFVKNATVKELTGTGTVASLVLADGQAIPCELVVPGIGVQPALDVVANSGIEVGDGIMVNEYLETSAPGIHAAGDVANYLDILFRKRRRVEHWDNAVSQGQHCGKALMGERNPFKHVPYFFSDVFDLSYEFWGDPAGADQIIHRGDLSSNSFSVWWLSESAVIAAFVMNRPAEERDFAQTWIESRRSVSAASLANVSHPISAI